MKYLSYDIVLKEIPGEVSLCFSMTGCPMKCKNCHSEILQNKDAGNKASLDSFLSIINKYNGLVTNILFFGGEWNGKDFYNLLHSIKSITGLKVSLYTGLYQEYDKVPKELLENLDYIKVGRYIEKLGGLDSKDTNQKLYKVKEKIDITSYFQKVEL